MPKWLKSLKRLLCAYLNMFNEIQPPRWNLSDVFKQEMSSLSMKNICQNMSMKLFMAVTDACPLEEATKKKKEKKKAMSTIEERSNKLWEKFSWFQVHKDWGRAISRLVEKEGVIILATVEPKVKVTEESAKTLIKHLQDVVGKYPIQGLRYIILLLHLHKWCHILLLLWNFNLRNVCVTEPHWC